jgi:cell division protein FtsL
MSCSLKGETIMAVGFNQSNVLSRLSGIAILLRTLLPIVLVIMFAYVIIHVPTEINRIRLDTQQRITEKHYIESAQAEIENLRQEVRRLQKEVKKARERVEQMNREMKKAVGAVHSTLKNVVGAMDGMRIFLQDLLNNFRKAINKIPAVNIPKVKIPKLRLKVPNLNISMLKLDLKPDLSGIQALQEISLDVAEEVENSMGAAGQTVSQGWRLIKVIFILFILWLLLFCGAVFQRIVSNIHRGWRLLMGN